MIFRRSLVRELTATAIGLFVVLLAILFTQSVIRILARAAGGAVAADGRPRADRLQRDVLFEPPAVGRAVPDRAAHAVALVPRQRDGGVVHVGPVADRLPEADPAVRRAVPGRDRAAVAVPVAVGRAAQDRVRAAARVARRDRACCRPACSASSSAPGIVVYVESINPVDGRIRNVFLHSVDDEKDATTVARLGHLEEEPNGDRFVVLEDGRRYEGKPGTAEFRLIEFDKLGRRIEPAEARALPTSNKAIPTAALLVRRRPQRARRALLAPVGADPGAGADAARDPAVLRQPAHGPLVQPGRGGVPVHALHQLPQHRAEHDRAGHGSTSGPGSCCRTSTRAGASCSCCSATSCRSPASSGARRAPPRQRRQPDDAHADPLHRPRRPALDAADLRRADRCCSRSSTSSTRCATSGAAATR